MLLLQHEEDKQADIAPGYQSGSGNQTQALVLVGQAPYGQSSSQLLRYICSPNPSVREAHFWLHRGAGTFGFAMEGLVPHSSEACVLEPLRLKLLTGKTQIPQIIPSLHGHRNEPRQSSQSMKYCVEVNSLKLYLYMEKVFLEKSWFVVVERSKKASDA